jgi:AraC-like DNA-binding protein
MATCNVFHPAPPLRRVVDRYVYVDVAIPAHVVKPLSPRAEIGITFNLDVRHSVLHESDAGFVTPIDAVTVYGPLSRRIVNIRSTGHYRAFLILFKGTGCYRLLRVLPAELADGAFDACDVAGPAINVVHEHLAETGSAAEMARIADEYLLSKLGADEEPHPIHHIAGRLVASGGRARLSRLAERSGLSMRQVERKFLEQIGISAKRYARIVRFRSALRLRAQDPALTWTDVSHLAGYYDQNHMVKEFRELAGATPSDYYSRSIGVAPQTELFSQAAEAPCRSGRFMVRAAAVSSIPHKPERL